MNSETPGKNQVVTEQTASRTTWFWICGTGVSALVGVGLARSLFPVAAWDHAGDVIGFLASIGIPISISQWLTLRYVPRYREPASVSLLLAWIPITSIGITCMILPLLLVQTELLLVAPWLVLVLILPGTILLALGQWLVLRRVISARFIWVVLTTMGAEIGAFLAMPASLVVHYLMSVYIPVEVVWVVLTGTCIAAFQVVALVSDLDADLRREQRPS